MTGALLLIGLLFLAAAALHVAGIKGARLAVALIMLTAPLEVYRTELAGTGNVSLFRFAVAFGLLTLLRDPGALVRALQVRAVQLLAVLPAVMAVSMLVSSDNRSLAISVALQAAAGLAAVVVIVGLAPQCRREDLLVFFLLGATVTLLLAGAQGVAEGLGVRWRLPLLGSLPVSEGLEVTRSYGSRMIGSGQLRLRGAFGDPNHAAAYLVLAMAVLVAFVVGNPRHGWKRVALAVWSAGLLAVLVATLSRSGWLAAVAAMVLLLGAASRDRSVRARLRPSRRVAVGAVLTLAVLAPLVGSQVVSRFDGGARQNEISNAVHRETATVAFQAFRSAPVFGIGLADLGPRLLQGPRTSGAHSSVLTVGAELGVVGLVGLALLFGTALVGLVRWGQRSESQRWVAWSLAAGYGGFIVANVFYDLYLDDYHWAFVGLALAVARYPEPESTDA